MEEFDVIVVGAGTGGCMAAKTLASVGLEVCLIDRKIRNEIGNKVCGDAIGKHHFDDLKLAYPRENELEREIRGIKIHSPDTETTFRVVAEGLHGFMINRHLFGQRLLNTTLDAGAVLKDSTHALEPIIREGFVRGVVAKDLRSDSKVKLAGRAVVDASGVAAVVRSKLPPELGIETEISKEDITVCYREIRRLKETVTEPDFCDIYLNSEVAPGGYFWVFPESGKNVNVGLGIAASVRSVNPKEQLYRHVLSKPLFHGSSIIHYGGGIVPTRKPLNSMVGNGVVAIGDAAYHVNPIHGGGMGPSMIAGMIAGETLIKAIEEDDLSLSNIWPVNVRYMRLYGAKQAGLDVFKIFLQGLNNADLNYGMKYRLIREEDILKAAMGEEIRINITEATRRIFRGLGRLSFLRKLRNMADLFRKAKMLYQEYPSTPKELDEWKLKVQALFARARMLMG